MGGVNTYLVHKGVAPGVAVGPGAADKPAVVVVPAFAPVPSLDDGDQACGGVAHAHLAVFAGSPEHREAVLVVLNTQRELAVIIVNLPHTSPLVVVYREHVSVVSLVQTRDVHQLNICLMSKCVTRHTRRDRSGQVHDLKM